MLLIFRDSLSSIVVNEMKNHKEWGVVVLCTRIIFASKQQNIVQYGYEKIKLMNVNEVKLNWFYF